MTYSLEEFESLLSRTQPVTEETNIAVLRTWRTELVRASVFISYAIGVLSLDQEMIERCVKNPGADHLEMLIKELPNVLAKGWVGGGWSLSPDASASVGAAAEIDESKMEKLLSLHTELITSDLNDISNLNRLNHQIDQLRLRLITTKEHIEKNITKLQSVIREKYKDGSASVDDWLA